MHDRTFSTFADARFVALTRFDLLRLRAFLDRLRGKPFDAFVVVFLSVTGGGAIVYGLAPRLADAPSTAVAWAAAFGALGAAVAVQAAMRARARLCEGAFAFCFAEPAVARRWLGYRAAATAAPALGLAAFACVSGARFDLLAAGAVGGAVGLVLAAVLAPVDASFGTPGGGGETAPLGSRTRAAVSTAGFLAALLCARLAAEAGNTEAVRIAAVAAGVVAAQARVPQPALWRVLAAAPRPLWRALQAVFPHTPALAAAGGAAAASAAGSSLTACLLVALAACAVATAWRLWAATAELLFSPSAAELAKPLQAAAAAAVILAAGPLAAPLIVLWLAWAYRRAAERRWEVL